MSLDENLIASAVPDALVDTPLSDNAYEIISQLGKGGMSVVYKARYLPLDQMVAVKILHAYADGAATMQRLKKEAKLASSLHHPNILRVYRLQVSDEGYPFLVSELVEGRTLQALLAEDGTLSIERFYHIFDQVLAALAHAHARAVVHRDIKPSNIMIEDATGTVKVVDFGIAKMLAESGVITQPVQGQTTSGHCFGSPQYMSPEQCSGKAIDNRSDIYSLALVMYEALAGKPAFLSDTAFNTMYQQIHDLPPRFLKPASGAKLPEHIEPAIFAALSKDPAERPRDVEEFRALLHGKTIWATFLPRPRAFAWRRFHKTALVGTGLMALTTAAAAGYVCLQTQQQRDTVRGASARSQSSATAVPELYPQSITGAISVADAVSHNDRVPYQKRMARATDILEHAYALLTTSPHDKVAAFQLKLQLGLNYQSMQAHKKARQMFLEALHDAPDPLHKAEAHYQLAACNIKGVHSKDAIAHAEQAARLQLLYVEQSPLEPDNKRTLYKNLLPTYDLLCVLYEKQTRYDLALDAAEKLEKYSRVAGSANYLADGIYRRALMLYYLRRKDACKKALAEFMLAEQSGLFDDPSFDLHARRAMAHELEGLIMKRLDGNPLAARAKHQEAVDLARISFPGQPGHLRASTLASRYYYQALNFYACNQLEKGDRVMAAAHEQWNLAGDRLTWPELKKACDDERAACLTRLNKPAEKPASPLLKD